MKIAHSLAGVFAATLLVGCVTSRPDPEGREALASADRAWAAAAAGRNAEEILAYLTEDAVMFPPGQPPLIGKAAIREYVAGSLALPGFSISWTTDFVELSSGGELGYIFGRSRYTLPDPAGGTRTVHAKGVTIWRKQKDGRWLCVADIWNDSPELPPLQPPRRPS